MTAARRAPTVPTARLELLKSLAWLTILGLLALLVKYHVLVQVDFIIAHWITSVHSRQLGDVVRAVVALGNAHWVSAVLILMSIWWWRRPGLVAVLWFTFGLGFLLQIILRLWVAQWRPDTLIVPLGITFQERFELAGFTSGHAFRVTFLFGWWAEWLGQHRYTAARLACLLAVVLVGWTRLYLDRHWASDVLGGWILAAAMLALARWMRMNWLNRQSI